MSEKLLDDKTEAILLRLYQKLLNRSRPTCACLGCHRGKINYHEKDQDKGKDGYCSLNCQIGYHSLIRNYDLGYKRGSEAVKKVIDERPDLKKLLEILDEPVIALIIVFSYPAYREKIKDMRAVLNLRGESQQLKILIDKHILSELTELSPEICQILTNEALLLFPNLTALYLASPENKVTDISRMTRLVHLEMGALIGDDSLIHLRKLEELVIVGENTTVIENSLSRLTNLKLLVVIDNTHLTNQSLLLVPASLTKLSLIRCPEIRNGGFFNFTNLDSLQLEEINFNDSALSKLEKLKVLKISVNENFKGDDNSLGNMPLLEQLFLNACPSFEGVGLRYKYSLNALGAHGTRINDFSMAGLINLTMLDIGNTEITDERLGDFINLERLSVINCDHITDLSLQKLTLLKFLDLSGCQRVSKKVLYKLTNLEELYLDRTAMKPGKNDPPLKLPNLTALSLSDTRAVLSREMVNFSNLRELSLDNNEIIQGKAYLRNLTNLTKLDLAYNQLIENDVVQMFSRLESIDLEGNTLIKSDALKNMPNLREIILRDGTVTDDYTFVDYV